MAEPGLRTNDARGVGLVFGPDATQVRPSPRFSVWGLRSHARMEPGPRTNDAPRHQRCKSYPMELWERW